MLFSRKPEGRKAPAASPADALRRAPSQKPLPGADTADGAGSLPQSYIGASLTIVGDLHAEGDVRLDGRICGNVRCAQLIVGRDATVTGAVIAEQAIVRGRITGTIRAPLVIIQDTAHVESDVVYSMLAVDDGAIFEGAAHRRDDPLTEEPAAPRLLELQQVTLAADGASGTRTPATGDDTGAEAATDDPRSVPEAAAARGNAALSNSQAANGHDPSG